MFLQYKQRYDESNRKLGQMAEQLTQLQRKAQQPFTEGAETEIIEALKQQIQICTEDFESERKDREKVQSKLHRALSENEHLKKEVRYMFFNADWSIHSFGKNLEFRAFNCVCDRNA